MATIDYTDRRRMRLDVEFYFAAAHRLPRYDGPCFRQHGHNYKFFIALEGEVDPKSGMIIDFGVVKQAVQELVLARADHRDLARPRRLLHRPRDEPVPEPLGAVVRLDDRSAQGRWHAR